jgi:RNA polymerase sigma factor (TIGR02999 family)
MQRIRFLCFNSVRHCRWLFPALFLPCSGGTVIFIFMSDVTRILSAIEAGDLHAAEQLLPLVYDELRKLAAVQMADDRAGGTLNPTALVHEAYLRLVGTGTERRYHDRGHFFAAAATAMRHIRIDQARRKKTQKHGGKAQRLDLDDVAAPTPDDELLALDEALTQLAFLDARKAQLVELRFFAGFSNDQAAAVLGVSPTTADRDWAFARAWLRDAVRGS